MRQTGRVTSFTFATAGRIIFGAGTVAQLPSIVEELGGSPFVCTGSDPRRHGPVLDALPGATAFAIPHFFYHLTTAYSILRNQGVQLTMGDFLGNWTAS